MESDDILNESLICCHLTFFPFPYSSTTFISSYFSFPCFDFFVYVSSPPYLSINHLTYSPSFFPSFLSSFLPCLLPSFLPSFLLSYLILLIPYPISPLLFHSILFFFILHSSIVFSSILLYLTQLPFTIDGTKNPSIWISRPHTTCQVVSRTQRSRQGR